ncbi:probable G-protein coupled receptor Mth-like 1, partial [Pollicipes pollicipes]|uniref:probable G-protein coupled receptor Mth-like 1 n=1 Tax=Pollicipes pollicipes TaxID=41117 RepID=UPI001884A78A
MKAQSGCRLAAGALRLLVALSCAGASLQKDPASLQGVVNSSSSVGKPRPLPDNLPILRWRQRGLVTKCCPEDAALVRRPGRPTPACEPVPVAHRWQPRLLNGRTHVLSPPDDRSAVAEGNVTCESDQFWVNSAEAGGEFELLNTGHLYLRRSDALIEPGTFCADLLLSLPGASGLLSNATADGSSEANVTSDLTLDLTSATSSVVARVCTVSLQDRASLLDPEDLRPACLRGTCLRKCCPRGLKALREGLTCVPQTGPAPWRPAFHHALTQPLKRTEYHTVHGNALCRTANNSLGKVFALEPKYYSEDAFFLQEDGRLWVPDQHVTIELADFCVDQVEYHHEGRTFDAHFAIVCFGDPGTQINVGNYVYRCLLLVSTLFLLATFAVYSAVPELRNLHGRCLMSHVAALFTAYVCNLASQLQPVYSSMAACQLTALVMYFSFLAACFWMNVMSFDIWLTFSRIRSATPNKSKTRRFIKYSAYCWGCSLALTLITIMMQFAPDDVVPPENFIRPGLGEKSCWFPGSWEMLAYFHW